MHTYTAFENYSDAVDIPQDIADFFNRTRISITNKVFSLFNPKKIEACG